jgi:hypothetical protein
LKLQIDSEDTDVILYKRKTRLDLDQSFLYEFNRNIQWKNNLKRKRIARGDKFEEDLEIGSLDGHIVESS